MQLSIATTKLNFLGLYRGHWPRRRSVNSINFPFIIIHPFIFRSIDGIHTQQLVSYEPFSRVEQQPFVLLRSNSFIVHEMHEGLNWIPFSKYIYRMRGTENFLCT